MIDKKLHVFAKKVVGQIEKQHRAGQKSITVTFHKLRKHKGSYKPGFKPITGKSMPSKVPKGFTKEAAGIFGVLTKKGSIIKKLLSSTKSKIFDHVKQHGKDIAKDVAKASAGFLAKRAHRLMSGGKAKITLRAGHYKTKSAKHIDDAISRVDSFLSRPVKNFGVKMAAVRLFKKKNKRGN